MQTELTACPAAQVSGQLADQVGSLPCSRCRQAGMKVDTTGSNHRQDVGGFGVIDASRAIQQLRPAAMTACTSRCMLGQLWLSSSHGQVHSQMQWLLLGHGFGLRHSLHDRAPEWVYTMIRLAMTLSAALTAEEAMDSSLDM